MSDIRPKTEKERILELAEESFETAGHTEELDAHRAPILLNHQNHPFRRGLVWHNVRHWHGPACRLPDCRLGSLEGKLGSSLSMLWSNSVEEPARRSRSLDLAIKTHQSVAMLPELLSNLAVSRTRSEPCILGKDSLRITLPLPGERDACDGSVSSTGQLETSQPPGDAEPLIGLEIQKDMVVLMHDTPELDACDVTTISETNKTSLTHDHEGLLDGGVSLDEVAQGHFNVLASSTCVHEAVENSHESHSLEAGQACSCIDTSFRDKVGIGSQVVGLSASETPHWDDWWTCQPEQLSAPKSSSDSYRVHHQTDQSCSPVSLGEVDEDDSDEGYLVLGEAEDEEQQESGSEHEGSDEEGSLENNCDAHNSVIEDSPTSTHSNNSWLYKEDDIWSDEQCGSLRMNVFPPPISILAHETQPGLPSHVSKSLWRSVKKDGRFVLQEVQARPPEFFQATRAFGRLRLQLVRPDSDSAGSYTETESLADKEGSSPSSESIETFTGVTEISQREVTGMETSEAGPSSLDCSAQVFLTFQVGNEISGGDRYDEDEKDFGNLTQSGLLPLEHGSMFGEEHTGAICGQMVNVKGLQRRAGAGLEDCVDQIDSNVVLEASSGADCSCAIEVTPREDEGCGRKNNHVRMARDMKELEICAHTDGTPSSSHGSEEPYRLDYRQPGFSATYGFDNNLSVLSPSQAFMQFPIQPVVR